MTSPAINTPEEIVVIQDLAELKRVLGEGNIDTSVWGQGKAKTVEAFLKELSEGEARLVRETRGLLRNIVVSGAHVFYSDRGNTLYLREEKQVFKKDGRERKRDSKVSVGEKAKPGETPRNAIVRGIREELGVQGNFGLVDSTSSMREEHSPSFPGLLTRYNEHHFLAFLHDGQFKAEGYVEEADDKTTYFTWSPIPNASE